MPKRSLPISAILGCLLLLAVAGCASGSHAVADSNHPEGPALTVEASSTAWIGPYGGLITALAVDPQNPANVYAASWYGGVFKSSDGGATWTRSAIGLNNMKVNALAIDPANPAILYAGGYKGTVYKTTDGAATWQLAGAGIQAEAIVYAIAIDPQDSSRVYLSIRGRSNDNQAPWGGVIYHSHNGGESWNPILSDLGGPDYQDWAYALAIHPNNPAMIFIATHEHGILRSQDYGRTWTQLVDGLTSLSTRAIAIDPRPEEPSLIYTGVWIRYGVFRSKNLGAKWKPASVGISGAQIYRLEIDPSQPEVLYAGTYNMGVMKSTDGSARWASTGLDWTGVSSLALSPEPGVMGGRVIFAGTDGDGLYKTIDSGAHWVHSQTGLASTWVKDLIVSPADPAVYYAGIERGGVLRSTDAGQTWSGFSQGLNQRILHALVMAPNGSSLFALTETGGMYTTRLDGLSANWQPVGGAGKTGGSRGNRAPLLGLIFAPSEDSRAYIYTGNAGVFTSTDTGLTWSQAGLAGQTVTSLAVSPLDANRVYAVIQSADQPDTRAQNPAGNVSPAPSVAESLNGGKSWRLISTTGLTVNILAFSASQSSRLLAGASNGVYIRDGDGWTRLGLDGQNVLALAANPARPDVLLVGTTEGAWISFNNGREWQAGPIELQGLPVQSINFSPHDPQVVFFNTPVNGTYRWNSGQ